MAEGESLEETDAEVSFIEQIRKAYGHDVDTESALARLAARYEPSFRVEQITRTSALLKEPKGWRSQFMCVISTKRQKLLHRRDWRTRSNEKERRGYVKGCGSKVVASREVISASKIIPPPTVHSGKSCSINTVPLLKGLSTMKEHSSTANRRSSRVAKEKMKQKKLIGSKESSKLYIYFFRVSVDDGKQES